MNLVPSLEWLEIPSNHQIIARWTFGGPDGARAIRLPEPPDPARFELLALGDTGDSDPESVRISAQDAVARELVVDASQACAVLHTGDVVYMTGERRLYDRNFRRPYAALLTPASTFENLVFRLPFLPVPGNHDYYDFARWAAFVVRLPVLGQGLRALARELFAFSLPQGGSGMGRAFMDAFVDQREDDAASRSYVPGEWTRVPNRYYQAQIGPVDLFALDSNTLDAPPPGPEAEAARAKAALREGDLRLRAKTLNRALAAAEAALERDRAQARARVAADPATRAASAAAELTSAASLEALADALEAAGRDGAASAGPVRAAARRLEATARRLAEARNADEARGLLRALEGADLPVREALRRVEEDLVSLPEGPARNAALGASATVEAARERARNTRGGEPPAELVERVRALSEEALDVQRLLASAHRQRAFSPRDHDADQLRWLDQALDASVRERPDAWRIVVVHHPPWTTLTSYCENQEIQGIRENLLPLLPRRVHAVVAGHAHAFEWIRSLAAPDIAFVVTGGGGQAHLRRSVVDPARIDRYRHRYDALRDAGVTECAVAGRGPVGSDGDPGPLHHYLRILVTPDVLTLKPVGVRRARAGWRREEPMPACHAPFLGHEAPWRDRVLEGIEVRRGAPPRPRWAAEPRA